MCGCTSTIQTVTPGHGFILFGQENTDSTYFTIGNADKSVLEPEKSLNDVFKARSKVLFDALPNPKPGHHLFRMLQATNVRKAQCTQSGRSSDSGDEAFLSDHDIAALLINMPRNSTP
ncbi:hypothetical protein HPB50_025645 [Hyalomma asiaticum]|uniref:Uncharacterized protein n=1 Tax=Hyalomma asiaticum TaxID=266040 RepID=A0ACB7TNN2_HYAAI|nr:hypothetical protein HPB50_025645 [Hyalomma asiaticum]